MKGGAHGWWSNREKVINDIYIKRVSNRTGSKGTHLLKDLKD